MARPAFITPELLVWARQRLNLSVQETADRTGIKAEKLQSWENGTCLPTVNQAKALAKKLKIPYVYFFLSSPPLKFKLPKSQDYRIFANQSNGIHSMEMDYLVYDVMQRREVIIELYQQMDIPTKVFDSYIDSEQYAYQTVATTVRKVLGLPENQIKKFKNTNDAFNYFLDAFSNIGILVFQASEIAKSEMRGMSIYEDIFPIVVVNRKDEYSARIFTLIHELVHLLTRTPGICDSLGMSERSELQIELKCNSIAAQILVPENLLKEHFVYRQIRNYGFDDGRIQMLAKAFSVSREVIIGRLVAMRDISIDFYNAKLQQYTDEYESYQKTKTKKGGFLPPSVDVCSQVGKLYARAVMTAYNQELITPRDASQFLSGLRIQHFDKVERWCFS
jgi:Zn-dependent peptidase ImmA (M78 family)/transcriptional regulator with XRE-family HTH domain